MSVFRCLNPLRTKRVRKQKTDRQDAQLILQLMMEDRFPAMWVPSWENRDLRQLLWHRHRMVQARTRIMNQLQALALNEGLRCKKRLCREAGREQLECRNRVLSKTDCCPVRCSQPCFSTPQHRAWC